MVSTIPSRNKELAVKLTRMAELYSINGVAFKPRAYEKAAKAVSELAEDIGELYKEQGMKGLKSISGVGVSIAEKIEEFLKKKKMKALQELEEKTALREVVTHYFNTKGIPLTELKADVKKQKIVYGRYAVPAKQLLELAGSPKKAKEGITRVADWANSRGLDYTIETVAKRWLELDRLKPKEKKKKAFFRGDPMTWNSRKKKWFVVTSDDEWLEFAGEEKDIEWKEE